MVTPFLSRIGISRLIDTHRRSFHIYLISACIFGCSTSECFENANLVAPPLVTNVVVKEFSPEPIYIGQIFHPNGNSVVAINAVNRFFSLRRTDSFGVPITFCWNDQTPPPFSPLSNPPLNPIQIGEEVSAYITIFNTKPTLNISCSFADAQEITSILELTVRVEDRMVVGEQTITQTRFNVPAGQHAVFEFPFIYEGPGNYNLNVEFTGEGIIETDTTDNNFSIEIADLGQQSG